MAKFTQQFSVVAEICDRWASSQGSGLPNDELDSSRSADPLPDDLAIEVDAVIRHAPREIRRLLDVFYRKRRSYPRVEDVAAYLGLRERRTVYSQLRRAHAYLLLELNGKGTLNRYHRRSVRDRALRVRRVLGTVL